jgi:hypothetical protein
LAIHALIQSVSYGFIEGLKVQIPLWHSGFSRRMPIVVVIVGIRGFSYPRDVPLGSIGAASCSTTYTPVLATNGLLEHAINFL